MFTRSAAQTSKRNSCGLKRGTESAGRAVRVHREAVLWQGMENLGCGARLGEERLIFRNQTIEQTLGEERVSREQRWHRHRAPQALV